MKTEDPSGSPATGLLWLIALSLFVIAICFVVMVLRMTLDQPPPEALSAADSHATGYDRVSVLRERRAAILNRTTPAGRRAPVETMSGANEERISFEEPPPAQEAVSGAPVMVGPGGSGGAPVAPAPASATNAMARIAGTVRLRGTPPPEVPVDLSGNAYCNRLQDSPLTTRFFVVGTNGGLADVLVFLKDGPVRRPSALLETTNELQFTNCQIEPYISAVTRDQKLVFRNSDATMHSVLLSVYGRSNRAIALTNHAVSSPISFSQPELFVRARCVVHPWEIAYVSILDNAFHAVTDAQGRFAITNVPPGHYLLEAIHRKTNGTNGITRSVTLTAGQTATVDFTIQAPAR